jgi:hypothetical protein
LVMRGTRLRIKPNPNQNLVTATLAGAINFC